MGAKQQVAYMLIADDSEQLKTELATIVGWPTILGLASDVRIGTAKIEVEAEVSAEGVAA